MAWIVCWSTLAFASDLPNSVMLLDDESDVPVALRALIEPTTSLLVWRRADLNLDGRLDYLFVLQRGATSVNEDPLFERQRPLKIALTQPNGKLRLVSGTDTLVMCGQCGGAWPDPFDELTAKTGSFTLSHYGGSRWRWSERWQFDFDRKANTWLLSVVTVGEDTPENGHQLQRYVRGRHFKNLPVAGFDREKFFAQRVSHP